MDIFNQDIGSNEIQLSMRQNGLFEVHIEENNIEGNERDDAHKYGRNQIDAVFATEEFLSAIRGRKQVCFGEVLATDHRGFLFDIYINYYVKINASIYDKNDSTKLNPNNRKHKSKFRDKLNECIDEMKLEELTVQICSNNPTHHEMNALD